MGKSVNSSSLRGIFEIFPLINHTIEYSDIYLNLKTIAKIDVHSFHLCIILQSILTQLTTNPTTLVPAERHLEEIISRRVYPDTSSLQLLCHTMSTFNVFSEDRCSKTVVGIIGRGNDFLLICKCHDHTHRAENLLTGNLISSDVGGGDTLMLGLTSVKMWGWMKKPLSADLDSSPIRSFAPSFLPSLM